MFWQSVLNGLAVLLHWQTYVVALMYFIITFLPIIVMILAAGASDELMTRGGCLAMLVQPLFQALAVFISVCTLFPIMLGGIEAAWSLPWMLMITEPVRTLTILAVMVVLSFIGAMLPILGRANSFIMFIMGGVVLVSLTLTLHKVHPDLGISDIELVPGWPTIIGIVLVSGISSWLGLLAVAAVATLVTMPLGGGDGISQLIMIPLGSVFGFIPIFIYAAWIGLQIKGLN